MFEFTLLIRISRRVGIFHIATRQDTKDVNISTFEELAAQDAEYDSERYVDCSPTVAQLYRRLSE